MRQNISDFLTTYCWTKIRHFLISLTIILFAGVTPALGAGYSCPTYMKYTSCNAGYYMVGSQTSTTYDGTPKAGNRCIACSNAGTGCTCAAGTGAPVCSVKITLNKNGGSGTCGGASSTTAGSVTCTPGSSCTLPSWNSSSCNITNGSKIFKGWSTSSSATSGVTSITAPTSATTYYAVWVTPTCSATNGTCSVTTSSNNAPRATIYCSEGYSQSGGTNTTTSFTATGTAGATSVSGTCKARTYTVTFNTNSATTGSPSVSSVTCTYGSACTAATQNTMLKKDSVFGGWNTNTSGTGTNYSSGGSIKNISTGANVTLYAKWTTCTACSAGTGAYCSLNVENNTCTYTTICKTGYNNLVNSGKYNPSCSAKCNKITLNANGGTAGSVTALYKKTGSTTWYSNSGCTTTYSTTTNVVPTRSGYTFRGFYSADLSDALADENNGTQYITKSGASTTSGTNLTVTGATPIYAAWAKDCTQPSNGSCSLSVSDAGVVDYTTSCNPGYSSGVSSNSALPSCSANCNAITLNAGGGTAGSVTTLYKKTGSTTWYSDSNCSTTYSTTTNVVPTRSGYTFLGFYDSSSSTFTTSTQTNYISYITASGDVVTASEGLVVTGPKTLYAFWAENCTQPSNGSCSLSFSPFPLVVSYNNKCDTGYRIVSGRISSKPVCGANSYTVVYDANGGTGTTASSTHTYNESKALTSNGFSLHGYTFGGWATSSSGAVVYSNGQSVSNLTSTNGATVTLYAKWNPITVTCPEGQFMWHWSSANGSTTCEPCHAGFYCPGGVNVYGSGEVDVANSAGVVTIYRCPNGYKDGGSGLVNKTDCKINVSAGKYIATENSTTQTSCSPGTYKDAHTVNYGSTSTCTTCPSTDVSGSIYVYNGTTVRTSPEGATDATQCYLDSSISDYWTHNASYHGFYRCIGKQYYSSTTGYYSSCSSAKHFSECNAGYFIDNSTKYNSEFSNNCSICAAGTYTTKVSTHSNVGDGSYHYQTSCSLCPAGTFNKNTGSTSADACETCLSAYPNSDAGTSSKNYCYKTVTLTGSQTTCDKPQNSVSHNCGTCNPGTCSYRDYYNATDGSCTPTNCKKPVAPGSVVCDTGFYTSNITCPQCTNKPSNSTYTGTATSNACPWKCNNGYNRTSANQCAQMCDAGIQYLKTGTNISIPLYKSAQTAHSIVIKTGSGTMCYGSLATGKSSGTINVNLGGTTYHTIH